MYAIIKSLLKSVFAFLLWLSGAALFVALLIGYVGLIVDHTATTVIVTLLIFVSLGILGFLDEGIAAFKKIRREAKEKETEKICQAEKEQEKETQEIVKTIIETVVPPNFAPSEEANKVMVDKIRKIGEKVVIPLGTVYKREWKGCAFTLTNTEKGLVVTKNGTEIGTFKSLTAATEAALGRKGTRGIIWWNIS